MDVKYVLKNAPTESLLNFGGSNDEEDNIVMGYMQSRIASNPDLRQQLQAAAN